MLLIYFYKLLFLSESVLHIHPPGCRAAYLTPSNTSVNILSALSHTDTDEKPNQLRWVGPADRWTLWSLQAGLGYKYQLMLSWCFFNDAPQHITLQVWSRSESPSQKPISSISWLIKNKLNRMEIRFKLATFSPVNSFLPSEKHC